MKNAAGIEMIFHGLEIFLGVKSGGAFNENVERVAGDDVEFFVSGEDDSGARRRKQWLCADCAARRNPARRNSAWTWGE